MNCHWFGPLPTYSPPASKTEPSKPGPVSDRLHGPSTAKLMPANFQVPLDWMNPPPPESPTAKPPSSNKPLRSKSKPMTWPKSVPVLKIPETMLVPQDCTLSNTAQRQPFSSPG